MRTDIMLFTSYHGTDTASCQQILTYNFRASAKIGWLGTGSYLFQDDFELAKYYPSTKNSLDGEQDIQVLKCEINIPAEKVYDVTDPSGANNKVFNIVRQQLIDKELSKSRKNAKSSEVNVQKINKNLDGIVFNAICRREDYHLVRAHTYTFQDIERKHPIFFTHIPNGTELCLRDNTYIVNKTIVGGESIG